MGLVRAQSSATNQGGTNILSQYAWGAQMAFLLTTLVFHVRVRAARVRDWILLDGSEIAIEVDAYQGISHHFSAV